MANSRFEYVKSFEQEHYLLPSTWLVMRIDGRGFHRISKHYSFEKPNDLRALNLMNETAKCVMQALPDTLMAYGDSDEYSFLLNRGCSLFERREAKLVSTFASTFTAFYIQLWPQFFPGVSLDMTQLPTFDCRAVTYPSAQTVRDYFSWRQADCHINNLYNTTFWMLVLRGNLSPQDAQERLSGTVSSDKNEILFSQFNINYNNEPEMFKKGSVIVRELGKAELEQESQPEGESKAQAKSQTNETSSRNAVVAVNADVQQLSKRQLERRAKRLAKAEIRIMHVDIIGDKFWNERPWILQ